MKKLTDKQLSFCLKYDECGNATEAYRYAYNAGGMKDETIRKKACELKKEEHVKAKIDELRQAKLARFEATSENVLRELGRIAFLDPRGFFHEDGRLKSLHELDENTAAALAGLDVVTIPHGDEVLEVRKFRFNSKNNALEQLARYLGLFQKDNDQGRKLVVIKDFTGKKND